MGSETRRAIIEFARQLLKRKEHLNVDKIAKALGISKPTFYYHFRNKGELIKELGAEAPAGIDRRGHILRAAQAVFATRGYTAATLDEIAREADVTKGAIYWHFKSKEELLRAVIGDALAPNLRAWMAQHADLPDNELIKTLLAHLAAFFDDRAAVVQIIFAEARHFPNDVLRVFRDLVLETVSVVGELIAVRAGQGEWRAVDPFAAVELLMLPLMVKTLVQGRGDIFPELATEPTRLVEEVSSIFLNGVRVSR